MKATNKFPPVAGELIFNSAPKYEQQVLIFRQKRLLKRGHPFFLRDCFKNKEFYKLINVKTLIPG